MHSRHSSATRLASEHRCDGRRSDCAITVGVLAGSGTLAAGRLIFDSTRNGIARLVIVLLFATPAAFTGYNVVLGLAHLVMESEGWQHVFAGVGALIIGLTPAVRLSDSGRASARARIRILTAQATRSTP